MPSARLSPTSSPKDATTTTTTLVPAVSVERRRKTSSSSQHSTATRKAAMSSTAAAGSDYASDISMSGSRVTTSPVRDMSSTNNTQGRSNSLQSNEWTSEPETSRVHRRDHSRDSSGQEAVQGISSSIACNNSVPAIQHHPPPTTAAAPPPLLRGSSSLSPPHSRRSSVSRISVVDYSSEGTSLTAGTTSGTGTGGPSRYYTHSGSRHVHRTNPRRSSNVSANQKLGPGTGFSTPSSSGEDMVPASSSLIWTSPLSILSAAVNRLRGTVDHRSQGYIALDPALDGSSPPPTSDINYDAFGNPVASSASNHSAAPSTSGSFLSPPRKRKTKRARDPKGRLLLLDSETGQVVNDRPTPWLMSGATGRSRHFQLSLGGRRIKQRRSWRRIGGWMFDNPGRSLVSRKRNQTLNPNRLTVAKSTDHFHDCIRHFCIHIDQISQVHSQSGQGTTAMADVLCKQATVIPCSLPPSINAGKFGYSKHEPGAGPRTRWLFVSLNSATG